jgi:hypothetical protein
VSSFSQAAAEFDAHHTGLHYCSNRSGHRRVWPTDLGFQSERGELARAAPFERFRGEERCVRQLRLDPASLRDPKIKAALVNHLDRQNKEPIHGEEEDFADDTSWLSDTVARIVDWNDPRQVCVLAISVDLPDQLGDHAKVAVPASCDGLRTA